MIELIKWLIWLYKNPLKNTMLSFWGRGVEVYVDGKLIMEDAKRCHNIAVVSKGVPYEGRIDSITQFEARSCPKGGDCLWTGDDGGEWCEKCFQRAG